MINSIILFSLFVLLHRHLKGSLLSTFREIGVERMIRTIIRALLVINTTNGPSCGFENILGGCNIILEKGVTVQLGLRLYNGIGVLGIHLII